MRGRALSIQQTRLREGKGAQAQAHHARAAPAGRLQRLDQGCGRIAAIVVPGRHDDDIGPVQSFQAELGLDAETGRRAQRCGIGGAHAHVERRQIGLVGLGTKHEARD
ncbi:hypothetical protein D3C72_1632340 [compost metagenome]